MRYDVEKIEDLEETLTDFRTKVSSIRQRMERNLPTLDDLEDGLSLFFKNNCDNTEFRYISDVLDKHYIPHTIRQVREDFGHTMAKLWGLEKNIELMRDRCVIARQPTLGEKEEAE